MPTLRDDQLPALLPIAGRKWRTSPDIQDRLRVVADLRRRGLRQMEIARRLHVSPATISRDLSRLDLIERHEQAETAYTQQLDSLLSLREAEKVCWAVIFRYRDDPAHAADVAAAARVIVEAQREARLLIAGARDPYAEAFDEDEDDEDDDLDADDLLTQLPHNPAPGHAESEIGKLRREVEAELPRFVSPKSAAIISRGLAIAEHYSRDDEAPEE